MKAEYSICGRCIWHRKGPDDEWYCNNEDSENYALETGYEDTCDDGFEER